MLYVIGEYYKQTKFLSSLINHLQGKYENKEEIKEEETTLPGETKLPEKVKINTKYYTTEIQVQFWTINEYLALEYKNKNLYTKHEIITHTPILIPNPEAILLIFSKIDLNQNYHLLSLLDKRYHPSNHEITRICCIIYNNYEEIIKENDSFREKMIINCNQFNYEFIILVLDTNNIIKQDDLLFSFIEGTKRVTQALYCTHWKNMYKQQIAVPNLENNKHHEILQYQEQDLDNYLDNFEFLLSMMRKMTCDIKHLSDQERRERASNLICDLAKYLNLDDEDDNNDDTNDDNSNDDNFNDYNFNDNNANYEYEHNDSDLVNSQ
ncbi:unnamed protein product [Cryptosporidium hominis]|uniref:Uncharacterized protein n=1 Tax=Cryptosporidium hominis TaxID=237895 RepID=A0A0S4TBX5_CRYHO|nr:Uncharacterized protein GY17_00001340 [Cryptosporidium hominis]CUV04283.1 unnamed protein product [Cryptosporidium hominis]|eukprot:PPS97328.1 Uncharacterized protein GY17_00001340 [Cryptosporidium hominis]